MLSIHTSCFAKILSRRPVIDPPALTFFVMCNSKAAILHYMLPLSYASLSPIMLCLQRLQLVLLIVLMLRSRKNFGNFKNIEQKASYRSRRFDSFRHVYIEITAIVHFMLPFSYANILLIMLRWKR